MARANRRSTDRTYKGNSQSNNSSRESGRDRSSRANVHNGTVMYSALAATPVQMLTAANIPYGYWAGTPVDDIAGYKDSVMSTQFRSIPGIYKVLVEPHVGFSNSANSPINLAARILYTNYTATTGRVPSYDPGDTIVVAIACGQCLALYEFLKRIYRIAFSYSAENRFLPSALGAACGVDIADISRNLSDFASWLETFRLNLGTLMIPKQIPFIWEFASMFQDVYLDSPDTAKAQMYVYVPTAFWKYDNTTLSTGAMLTPVTFNTSTSVADLHTFGSLRAFAENLIAPLLYDTDAIKIMSDILQVYGAGSNLTPDPIVLGAAQEFKFDPAVLATLHNCTALTGSVSSFKYTDAVMGEKTLDSRCVYQNSDSTLIHTPQYIIPKVQAADILAARFFDMPIGTPTPVDNILASRLTCLASSDEITWTASSSNATVAPTAFGTAICRGIARVDYSFGSTGTNVVIGAPGPTALELTALSSPIVLTLVAGYTKTSMFPLIGVYALEGSTSSWSAVTGPSNFNVLMPLGDFNNYTIIEQRQLEKMHSTHMLGQFNIQTGV